jgi:6-phosphogluconolactonase (cycloisomerase 2 family)
LLTSIGSSPSRTSRRRHAGSRFSHDGQFLFTVNTASNSISSYAIAADGSLGLVGSMPLATAHAGAEDARLSPGGGTLWVVDTGADAISAFAVNGGSLSELSSSPTGLPAGAAPFGIVVT